MIEILIIEDEPRAASHLSRVLNESGEEIKICSIVESIDEATSYLKENGEPSLIISDIQLSDGLSFEIFDQVKVENPVIFVTAYDQYAIEAFRSNGIDYLLKPVSPEDVVKALDKFKRFTNHEKGDKKLDYGSLAALISGKSNDYKSRFMIKVGEKIKSIGIEEVDYFYSLDKATFLRTKADRNFVLDYSLEQVVEMLDPKEFFRINRKYIIKIDAIKEIVQWSNSRYKVVLDGTDEDVLVARERVKDFKNWLDS